MDAPNTHLTVQDTLNYLAIEEAGKKMPRKYRTFSEALLSGQKPAQAVITAGYEVKSPQAASNKASGLAKKDIIREYLALRYRDMQARSDISLDEVKGNARNIYEKCSQSAPVIDRKTGEPTGEWTFDASGANKANDTLMRLAGLDKTDTGARTQIQFAVTMGRDGAVLVEGEAAELPPDPDKLLEE